MSPPGNRQYGAYALVAIVGLVAVLPVWVPTFPAMCDVPQHAAQVVIFSRLDDPGFVYSSLFVRHTGTPYLIGYLFLLSLTPIMGVVAACKLTAAAALLGLLFAAGGLIAEFDGDPRLALLVIPGMYGFPFEWGLLTFLTAAPLGICFLILAKRYFENMSTGRGAGLVLFFLLVFCCHAMVAAYFAGLAALYALANLMSARQLFLRWLPILATVPAAGLWWYLSVAQNPETHQPMEWDPGWDRVPKIFLHITGWPGALPAFLFIAALLLPVVLLLGFRRRLGVYLLLGACVATALFGPNSMFGVAANYQRFAIFLLPLFALTLAPAAGVTPRRRNLAAGWAVIFVLAWTAGVAWRMNIFEREARGFSVLVQQMAPGQRVLSLNFERNSSAFQGAVFLHHPAWYSALKSGVVDPNFAEFNVSLVQFRPDAVPKVHISDFEFHPDSFDWEKHEGWRYRYFVVHSPTARGAALFPGGENVVKLIAHDGDWWLYENTGEQGASGGLDSSPN